MNTNTKIDPKQVIKELSVEELCQSAERFFQGTLDDPTHVMARPVANTVDTPQLLYRMGLLLSGLRLGMSMVVLDFGSGACWFSRLLNQMQCVTISVDVSETALELGKRLFEISPIVGEYLQPPRFVHFDGRRIELDDETVDRIVCFDAFHHVPNQRQVLKEFFRVLKPGGVAGFGEPGIYHSQSERSQSEMREFTVLENDIRLDEIKEIANEIGFSGPRVKLVNDLSQDLDYDTYERIIKWPIQTPFEQKSPRPRRSLRDTIQGIFRPKSVQPTFPIEIFERTVPATREATIFFLEKGTYIPDSRDHTGLKHKLEILTKPATIQAGATLQVKVRLENVGTSKWLHRNIQDVGVVKLGIHLLDANQRSVKNDFARGRLETDVMPGQSVAAEFSVVLAQAGEYILHVDLVSEHVCWFGSLGSQPQYLRVNVT